MGEVLSLKVIAKYIIAARISRIALLLPPVACWVPNKGVKESTGKKMPSVISATWYADEEQWILAGSDKPRRRKAVGESLVMNEHGIKEA